MGKKDKRASKFELSAVDSEAHVVGASMQWSLAPFLISGMELELLCFRGVGRGKNGKVRSKLLDSYLPRGKI